MNRGFLIILCAQFLSSLADNALLFVAIEALRDRGAPAWQTPVLQDFFVISFILLAPFVGAFADSLPKGRVMFISNGVKMGGCLALLINIHPLLAYGFVGMGSALYSPAKYGILTEYLPDERLVWANGWMEGLTVTAIILGAILGGFLVGNYFDNLLANTATEFGILFSNGSSITFATGFILVIYALAAVFNLFIPVLAIEHELPSRNPQVLWFDFWTSFVALWKDPLGQVSLAVTSLFWGAGTTLRFIILSWAASALSFDVQEATQLTAVVAVGLALGALLAAKFVPLHKAIKVLPLGIAMGIAIFTMAWISHWLIAFVMLIIIGALAGCFLIPMNALLQHRGHQLMGSGHSIALQNFNENASMLFMLGTYALMVSVELSIYSIVISFGVFLAAVMTYLTLKNKNTIYQ
jgi:MFS family permease